MAQTKRREETNICEVLAVTLQRIRDLDAELATGLDDPDETVYMTGQRDELVLLCRRLGWDKYLAPDIANRVGV